MDNMSMVLGLLSGSKELVGEVDADWVAAEAKRDAWKAGAMMKLPPHLQLPPGRQFPTGVDWSAFSGSAQATAERTEAGQQWRRANAALNRLIALAKMIHHPSLGILTRRREFNLRGIEEHMLTRGPESAVGGQEQVSDHCPASEASLRWRF